MSLILATDRIVNEALPPLAMALFSGDQTLVGRSILLVEDEMLVLMAAEDMLTDLGCRSVATAATLDQALGLIMTEFLDAALLDVNLNGDRSYPVADALAARGIPFAFTTGYGAHGLRDVDLDRPMLMKSYRSDDFAEMLTALLHEPAALTFVASETATL